MEHDVNHKSILKRIIAFLQAELENPNTVLSRTVWGTNGDSEEDFVELWNIVAGERLEREEEEFRIAVKRLHALTTLTEEEKSALGIEE